MTPFVHKIAAVFWTRLISLMIDFEILTQFLLMIILMRVRITTLFFETARTDLTIFHSQKYHNSSYALKSYRVSDFVGFQVLVEFWNIMAWMGDSAHALGPKQLPTFCNAVFMACSCRTRSHTKASRRGPRKANLEERILKMLFDGKRYVFQFILCGSIFIPLWGKSAKTSPTSEQIRSTLFSHGVLKFV